jgi:dihydroorotate dehydrogenase electron transfer subunit
MTGQKVILVGGGIGVAPLVFLAQTVKTVGVTFMAGYRSVGEVVSMDRFGLGGLDLSVATDDGTKGHKGPVTDLLKDHLSGSGTAPPMVFTCGPLPMLKRVSDLSVDRGFPFQVSLEASMACGLGACQGCAVKASPDELRTYYHVCQDGPVFHGQSLDWESL